MSAAGDRFRVQRRGVVVRVEYLTDSRGRVREWGDVRRAARALIDAGHDLTEWQVWRGVDTGFGFPMWRAVPGDVRDAVRVLAGDVS